MLSVEDRYYKINRILLKVVGLWPYQDVRLTRVLAIITTIFYLSAIFVQLAVFMTHECTMDIVLKVLSFVFPSMFMLFMYDIYYFNSEANKKIMEYMYSDWKSLNNKAELNIMDDYANTTKLFTQIFLYLSLTGLFVTIMSHVVPMTLDIISPLNESRRGEHIHIEVEYFIDWSKYYYWAILHLTTFICIGGATVLASALSFLCYGYHACALFKVANYKMEVIMDKNVLRISGPEIEHIMYEKIIGAVNAHRRAIQYCEFLLLNFQRWFLFVLTVGVTSLSINLFRFLKAITEYNAIVELCIPTGLLIAHFSFLFFGNYIAQQITNNNAEIFNSICKLPWYIAPLNIQRLLLFLLLKSNKNIYLSICGIFYGSLEGFTSLSMSSISYFTVIYALQ